MISRKQKHKKPTTRIIASHMAHCLSKDEVFQESHVDRFTLLFYSLTIDDLYNIGSRPQENMSKILKAILIGAYGAVILQFIRTLRMERYDTLIELNYVFRTPGTYKKFLRELKQNKNSTRMSLDYKRPERLPTDLKFILKYSAMFYQYRSETFNRGQHPFIEANCTYSNCYLTKDKFLLMEMRNFDAIIIDAENTWDPYPIFRAPHQTYIFSALESNYYYPICNPNYDGYFNLTWSYRLDSDISWTYLVIVDNNNTVVGPKINMTWISPMPQIPDAVRNKLTKKKKMAAWFVSNCNPKSGRNNVTEQIRRHLVKYGFDVDIFGQCGSLVCPSERMEECLELLQEQYYFYFAFENSKGVDYVTEKLLHAVLYYTVPVVYGGANYTRFLPPGSYINAGELEPYAVASIMIESVNVNNKDKYYDFFRWHNYYMYKETPEVSNLCKLCRMLNERSEHRVLENFRQWWNPHYKSECRKEDLEARVDDLQRRSDWQKWA